jgi:hypothetical protein
MLGVTSAAVGVELYLVFVRREEWILVVRMVTDRVRRSMIRRLLMLIPIE